MHVLEELMNYLRVKFFKTSFERAKFKDTYVIFIFTQSRLIQSDVNTRHVANIKLPELHCVQNGNS